MFRILLLSTFCLPLILRAESEPAKPELKPLAQRIADRAFPSVFQAWSPADNLKGEDRFVTMARHDLVFHSAPSFLNLAWKEASAGLGTEFTTESVGRAKIIRDKMRALNPNQIFLSEVRYRDAWDAYLPADHKWWKRKPDGQRVPGWEEGKFYILDFQNAEFRAHVARQCKAIVETGLADGVMLDWWEDDEDRLALIKAIREAIGEQALILVNANDRQIPRTAQFINGVFMECYRSKSADDWARIETTLAWAEEHLRQPRINCVETWYEKSRQDLNRMRATTTLSLTRSDGYCLFSDPNELPSPDHLHDWYPFWDKSLGKATGKGKLRPDGAWERD